MFHDSPFHPSRQIVQEGICLHHVHNDIAAKCAASATGINHKVVTVKPFDWASSPPSKAIADNKLAHITGGQGANVITLPANAFMAEIHNDRKRTPAILGKADYDVWLHGTPSEALAVLQQYPEENLEAWPVGKRVNTPKNNGPELIEPITRPIPPRVG